MPTRIRKGLFFQYVALPTAGQSPCQRREMTLSTIQGPVHGPVHNLVVQFFTLGSSKISSQRSLDQSQAGVYRGEHHIPPPFWAFLGVFGYPTRRA